MLNFLRKLRRKGRHKPEGYLTTIQKNIQTDTADINSIQKSYALINKGKEDAMMQSLNALPARYVHKYT